MRGLDAATAGGAALLCLFGCRQVLGVDSYGTIGDYPGKNDGILYSSQSCRDCVDRHCAEQATKCSAEPACAALAQCLARCTLDNYDCRGKCNLSTPDTLEMRELVQCEASNRCTECGSSRAVWNGAPCDKCMQNCTDELDAFSKDEGALNAGACQRECPKSAPHCDCSGYPDAGQEPETLTNIRACAEGPCSPTCTTPPPDWTCLGNAKWQAAALSLDKLELYFRATNVIGDSPVSGLSIKACPELDPACVVPSGDAAGIPETSQPLGWANLPIERPTTAPKFFGHLVASGPDFNALLYLFPPVRLTPSWRTMRLVSRSAADAITTAAPLNLTPHWESNGGIVWSVTSCNKAPPEGVKVSAAGVRVTISSGERAYYSSSDITLDPNLGETTSVGLGVFINVRPSLSAVLTAKVTVNGKTQDIGTYPVQVKKGSITHVAMAPGGP